MNIFFAKLNFQSCISHIHKRSSVSAKIIHMRENCAYLINKNQQQSIGSASVLQLY